MVGDPVALGLKWSEQRLLNLRNNATCAVNIPCESKGQAMRVTNGLVWVVAIAVLWVGTARAEATSSTKAPFADRFRQLEGEAWPTPGDYRNASGAPGSRYWQQKVDYQIAARLDEDKRTISGRETITYTNNSPDALPFLWLLLDQNIFKRDSLAERSQTVQPNEGLSLTAVRQAKGFQSWSGGYRNLKVTDEAGRPLKFTVVDTLMRVDLPQDLKPGARVRFIITFDSPIIESRLMGARDGYECFTKPDEDGNCIFLGAQFFPRLAVYSDYEGWHNKAFLDGGEFTLEFGDYDVSLTVPSDHVVAATGVLQNPEAVLSPAQRERLNRARTAAEPLYVVTPSEALAAEKGRAKGSKTWRFAASNVRDFAFASSRKFVWDAMGVKQTEAGAPPLVMAMSFYPKEGRPLWDAYSTKAVAHTLKVYGRFAVPYPYPVAQSVNGPVGGMEYPMISFNGPRPVKDKQGNLTYSERTKNGLIGVVIHEVGHNWFPMIINSDERQWTWMDEGLNTFLQFQAEMQWDKDFKTNRGEPRDIVEYMISADQVPIMTQSDSLKQFGNNAYGKPATALVILRETVMGRDLFDEAFKTYARRWRFKHPTPYDFFRTMEEVSGIDLDWFWRGWFYSTDHVDIALDTIIKARLDSGDPAIEGDWRKGRAASEPRSLTTGRNTEQTVVERDPTVRDYFNRDDRYAPTRTEIEKAKKALEALTPEEREARAVKDNVYRLTFSNLGGLVMPIPLKLTFEDGSTETVNIPAEIWRRNSDRVTWQYMTPKTLVSAEVDPFWEIADADLSNNAYPRRIEPTTIEVRAPEDRPDRMQGNRLSVTPDSLAVQPAKAADKVKDKDADKEDTVPATAP